MLSPSFKWVSDTSFLSLWGITSIFHTNHQSIARDTSLKWSVLNEHWRPPKDDVFYQTMSSTSAPYSFFYLQHFFSSLRRFFHMINELYWIVRNPCFCKIDWSTIVKHWGTKRDYFFFRSMIVVLQSRRLIVYWAYHDEYTCSDYMLHI